MVDGLAMPNERQAITPLRKHFSEIRQLKTLGVQQNPTGKFDLLHTRRKLALE